MYRIIGGFGMLGGLLTILLIKEPGRGVYDFADQFKDAGEQDESLKRRKQKIAETEAQDKRGPF